MTGIDWGTTAATLVTGLAAVGAAYWTIKRTERAARAQTRQQVATVAARTAAVLEVSRERIQGLIKGDSDTSELLPWHAFSALSAEIGVLGIDATRLYFYIERLARTAEGSRPFQRENLED